MVAAHDDAQRCEYEHDVSDELFDDVSGDRWRCPHRYDDAADYCPVHRSSVDTRRARSFVVEACQSARHAEDSSRFIGACCGGLDLSRLCLDGTHISPLDLRDATFEGDVLLNDSRICRPLKLNGADINGTLDCSQTTFEREFLLSDATIQGDTTFEFTEFKSWCEVSLTEFEQAANFNGAVLTRGIDASETTFTGRADFVNTNFEELANFREATFAAYANFSGPEFHLDARFDGSTFDGPAFFETTKFQQVSVFRGAVFEKPVSFRNCTATGRISFQNAKFAESALFPGAQFGAVAIFDGSKFKDAADFSELSISEARFAPATVECPEGVVSFTQSDIESGRVQIPESGASVIDFTDATLGDVELRSEHTELMLDSFILNNVRYDGFQFNRLEGELLNRGGRLDATKSSGYTPWWIAILSVMTPTRKQEQERLTSRHIDSNDPSVTSLERTYRKAKNGADNVGQPKVASHFFRKEMEFRRKRHWKLIYTASESSARRLTAVFQWLANAVMYAVAGYGERPSRTVVTSVASIFLFAGAYAAYGIASGGPISPAYLLISAQSFVTFILGDTPDSVGAVVEFLAVLQAFLGGFLVAVFVFALTRTVYR